MRLSILGAILLSGSSAMAQTGAPPRAGAPMPGMAPAFVPMNPAVQADQDAMKAMMAGMDKPYTGDPDQDFVSHMMPHHQGAIEMAETEIKFGSDPKLKEMAARIISAQQHEIRLFQAWQSKHPVHAARPDNPHIQEK